jgi:hypothetical protein
MLVRNVSVHLKSNLPSNDMRTVETDTLLSLRKQNGIAKLIVGGMLLGLLPGVCFAQRASQHATPSATTAPNANTVAPNEPTVAPNTPTVSPSEPTVAPNSPTIAPNGATVTPNGATVAPSAPTAAPDAPTVAPDAPTTGPSDTSQKPPIPSNTGVNPDMAQPIPQS